MTDELTWASAREIAARVVAREVSPVEVLEHFLGRIEDAQPVLNAFDHLDLPRARADAAAAERAVLAGDEVGSLIGVPTAVKAHIDIAGVPETLPFGMGIARKNHPVIDRLRAAGAIVVGHTTMPAMGGMGEFVYDASARNAWDTSRTPGISSAGTAAALMAGLLPVAIGSDGGGSSRLPAAYSGYVGVHPTPGLVPWVDSRGQTFSDTSTIGPAARDAHDAALVLSVIAGTDPRDQGGLQVALPDPCGEIHRGADGLRIAWTEDFGFAREYAVEETERVIAAVRTAVLGLSSIGVTVDETPVDWENYLQAFCVYSFAGVASLGIPGVTVATDEEWDAAADVRTRMWQRFARIFEHHDLVVSPTIHSVAPPLEVFAERVPDGLAILRMTHGTPGYTYYTAMCNWLRLPAVSVPCGTVDGLPVGMQIIGPPGSEARILRLANEVLKGRPVAHPGDRSWS